MRLPITLQKNSTEPTRTGYTFVKWQLGGADVSAADTYGALVVTGTGLLPSDNPTYDENHAFVEWQYNGTKVTATNSYGSLAEQDTKLSITLKAIWTQVSDYTVTKVNGTAKKSGEMILQAKQLIEKESMIKGSPNFVLYIAARNMAVGLFKANRY